MSADLFTPEMAARYDARFAPLSALKAALHLVLRATLAELPADARLLCVGAGTGAELLALAAARPGWRFTVVEPSPGMLSVCQARAAEAGVAARCTFHDGYLDSLPGDTQHDGATSILVSQFILDPADRRAFYAEIARRLRPNAPVVTADLVVEGPATWSVWLELMRLLDMDDAKLAAYRQNVEEKVALVDGAQMRAILTDAGFVDPLRIQQAGMIQAHVARRTG